MSSALTEIDSYLEAEPGKRFERYTAKIGIDAVLSLPQPQKAAFLEKTTKLVDFLRQVAIKSNWFVTPVILTHLDHQRKPLETFFSHTMKKWNNTAMFETSANGVPFGTAFGDGGQPRREMTDAFNAFKTLSEHLVRTRRSYFCTCISFSG